MKKHFNTYLRTGITLTGDDADDVSLVTIDFNTWLADNKLLPALRKRVDGEYVLVQGTTGPTEDSVRKWMSEDPSITIITR